MEKAFKEDQFVNQLKYKPSKEFDAFSFRPNTKELQCDLNSINVQEVEQLTVNKLQLLSNQMKNQFGFRKLYVLDQQEQQQADFKHVVAGSGMYLSMDSITYGGSLFIRPEIPEQQNYHIFSSFNKYLKQRPLVGESKYEQLKHLRTKMEKVGATPLEVEKYVIEQMREAGKMDDIVTPGETGQQRRVDELNAKKLAREKDEEHLKEPCQDILDG